MKVLRQRLLGLCLPPLLLCLFDGTITLLGQSSQYWAGDYLKVSEDCPIFHYLLQIHPAAYMGGISLWAVLIAAIILLLPDMLALIASIMITYSHLFGAATWFLFRFHFSLQFIMILLLATATILGVCIRWGWRAVPEQEYRIAGLPPIIRWLLAAALVGLAAYLFLGPWKP